MAGGTHAPAAESGSGDYSLLARPFVGPVVTTPTNSSPPVKKVIPSRLALDYPIQLRFDQEEHPYLFPASAEAPVGPALERILLPYPADDNRRHSYFQDMTKPNLFYYLPDSFKLSRALTAPFLPNMAIDFGQNEGSDKVHVTVTAVLRPAVNVARLEAATSALKARIPLSSVTTNTEPELQPLQAKATLKLGLPRSGQIQTVETDAVIDLVNGFLIDEDFGLSDFQTVFAALNATGVSAVFRGDVVVSTGLAAPDFVPVEIRFAEMEGQMLICDEKTDSAGGTITATLRNATESPLRIEVLLVWLTRGGAKVVGEITDLDLSTPIVIEPTASITITIRPTQPLPGQEALDAIFDLSRVRSQPDPQKILASITDQSVLPEARRRITVVTAPDVFADKATPETSISYLGVEFLGGTQVLLRANEVQKEVDVPVPLVDWLLKRDTEGIYTYRKVIGFKSGNTSQPSAWTRSDLGILSV